jgi:hypothetical protein
MSWHIARRALAAVAVLAIVIVGSGFAFLHLPALEDARSRIAANLLSSYLGEAVVVNGGVDVTLGRTIDVAVQGVVPAAAASVAPESTAPVGTMRMSFSRDAALRGRLDLTELDLSSVRVIIDATAAGPSKETLGRSVSSAVEGVLSSPMVRSLKLEDVQILRINDPAGWNGSLFFDTVTSRETDRAGAVSVEAKGSLHGQVFTLSGNVPDLSLASGAERGHDMWLKLAFKGIEAALDGRLAQDVGGLTLAARLDVTSPSLGDVQDVLKLARAVEGTGTLGLALDGALAKLAIGSAKLRIETADGRVYEADGGVADMWAVDGIDVGFAATLVPPGAAKGKSRFNLAPRSIKGRVTSKEGGFEIDSVVVETGLASIELANLGPIRIGQIARDEKGLLRLEDIRLVQGDPKDPILDLTGNLNDALELRDFSLKGSFRLGMAGVLTGRRDATGVGALRGKVAMSDASGHLRLETLDAKLEGTDLMSLSLRLAESGKSVDGVGLKFNVPDLAHLASALGRKASAGIQIAFDGTIGGADGAATVLGSGRVGKTDLEGRLRIAAPKRKPEITGKISSKDLHLDSLTAAREVFELFSEREIEVFKLREDVQEETTLSLDIAADAVEGGGETAGGLKASVVYAKSRLRVSPVELVYLGGSIKGDVDANLAPSPPALKLKATVRKLGLKQFYKRLDKAPAASGPLDLDLAVTANGADLYALLASMSGHVSGSIRGGSLADRTINLAGQTIIGWMFTRTADGSAPLMCFVARFDFKDGIGTARQLVLETDKVQAAGGGTLNLRNETMDFVFTLRAKRNDLAGKVGPVHVSGPLSKPEIKVADGAVAAKVIGETIGLPFHLLGAILGADGQPSPEHTPCIVVPDKE